MTSFRLAFLSAALLAGAALPALAQPAPGTAPGAATGSAPGSATPGPRRGPEAMFNQIDANHDGRVVWDEAWSFVQQRFTEADRDHDGGLTQEEMRAARVMRMQARDGAQQANRPASSQQQGRFTGMMFRMLDANRDGKVTLDEIRPMVEARFRGFDANGDNAVTLDEVPQRAAHRHHRAPAQRQPG